MRDRARLARDVVDAALLRRGEAGPLVVGVAGIEGSGARGLADELVQALSMVGESPILVLMSDFAWPSSEWLSGDPDREAQEYYSRGFDLGLLVTSVLEPYRAGLPVELQGSGPEGEWSLSAEPDDTVVLSGPFLMRSEVRPFVDYLVSVEPSAEGAKRWAADRGATAELVTRRLLPAAHMHAATHPAVEHADLVVDLAVPASPKVLWRRR